jgi:esterase/lipase superfamily enzyme
MPMVRQCQSGNGCKTQLGAIIARVTATLLLLITPFFTHTASAQTAASQTADRLDVRRSKLEHDLAVERDSGKTAEDASIQGLEDELMQARLNEEIAKQPQGPTKGPKLFLKTQILYATNRQRQGRSYSSKISNSNTVEVGTARVTIGIHEGIRTDYLPDATFVSAASYTDSPEITSFVDFDNFRAATRREAKNGKSTRKILLFVHGFNTSFEDALKRTALIAVELQTPVIPMTYSWPSADSVMRYSLDEEMIRASNEAFTDFLKQIASDSPAEIVIVCHSMGAREVASALASLAKEKFDTKKLSRVVFVASDIFTTEFQSEWPSLASLKKIKYTFYASDSDLALTYSFLKHDAHRLGYVDANLWSPPGASTIDASNVDSILNTFGHSYIENPQLGADMGTWLTTGADPTHRGLLERPPTGSEIYFFP